MKAKILVSTAVSIFAVVLLAGWGASAARIKEPTKSDSTLLIGRIRLVCTGFPKHLQANGDHTKGITIDLKDSSNKFISATSRGSDGFFYFADLDIGQYAIVGFQIQIGDSRTTLHLDYKADDHFTIEKSTVNNLGDIVWYCDFIVRGPEEYTEQSVTTMFSARDWHEYKGNYDECKSWFEENYPKSDWKTRNWTNTQIF